MQRPLKKRVGDESTWSMRVRESSHEEGFTYPVFEWSFGAEHGALEGELRAWSPQRMFVFQKGGASARWDLASVEKVLKKIDEDGWGEPPHIDEVFQGMSDARKYFPQRTLQGVQRVFDALKTKWENVIVQHRAAQESEKSRGFWNRKLADIDVIDKL